MKSVLILVVTLALAFNRAGAGASLTVYPSGPTVPENLLRIELRFSAPLYPPLNITNLRLENAAGTEVKDAFLDLLLPSRDDHRVTVLLHPGRIKTGVRPNLTLGRALRAGETVTLIIHHPQLPAPVRKSWRVTAFERSSPQPSRWTVECPRAGTPSDLLLHFDKPISSTAEQMIAIRGPNGERLAGTGRLANSETVWRFTPSQPWQPGRYAIVTHPNLEDVAGNRLAAPFEASPSRRHSTTSEFIKSFEIACSAPGYPPAYHSPSHRPPFVLVIECSRR